MKAHLYKMTCLTNLHVGNGDVNYSIIDNEVEKDPVIGEAVIPSSGVKGALREYAKSKGFSSLDDVFGNDNDKPGSYKFLSAALLARPVRVTEGEGAYVLGTSNDVLKAFDDLCTGVGLEKKINNPVKDNTTNAEKVKKAEGCSVEYGENKELDKLLGEKWAVMSELKNISLPVSARNCLDDNGKSKNLWYEEYVPHHSIFYLVIITPGEENLLDSLITGGNAVIQFGADASVGCGLMKLEKM